MMRYRGIVLVALGCRVLSAQAAGSASGHEAARGLPALDSARLLADLSALAADSMEGRRIGTPGGARARAYLMRALTLIELAPASDRLDLPFTAPGRGGATLNGVNLAAVVRGTVHPGRYVVVSAHYDHLGIGRPVKGDSLYNGADDNASGTAGVLAIARWFKGHPPENSIIFALFDGEEAGDLGSKAFVERPPVPLERIIANVNLDMVSRNARGELYAAGATPNPVMRPLLERLAASASVTLLLGHDTGLGQDNWTGQSDQSSFHAKEIPWVYFGVEDHPDYHRPSDDAAHIQPAFFYHAVQTVAAFVSLLDASLDRIERADSLSARRRSRP
jgi:Zn-dependent M28 family amino/carboxypeptidase